MFPCPIDPASCAGFAPFRQSLARLDFNLPEPFSEKTEDGGYTTMHGQRNKKSIRIVWEHHPDSNSAQHVRQAVELILAELDRDATAENFDKIPTPGHDENVPVENNNQSSQTTE